MDNAAMDEFVNKVREHSDIYSVVSRYVPLTMKNGRYWACCPFHNEKTASFSVIPDKGIFYCFGCHVGGNVFKFISLIENITYFDAIKLQAERLGIPLPAAKQRSSEEIRREREHRALLKACEFACEFYHDNLIKTPEGEIGRKYFESRGITSETIKDFKLGFAPNVWDGLINEMTKRGFDIETLINAGLVARGKKSKGFYDRFRGRVIIPIRDIFGRVTAFGGRILQTEDEHNPKYLNSPETEIFKKGQLLFGLDKAHHEISRTNMAVIVEGYMDAISVADAGFKNVVATLGTAFTEAHTKLLLRYARKVILCYDNDEAGKRATMRALPIISNSGLDVFIANITDAKDPDEFIRKYGPKAFNGILRNASTLIDYSLKYYLDKFDPTSISGKIQILDEVLPLIANVKNVVLEQEYRKKIALSLIIDEDVIQTQLYKVRKRMRSTNRVPFNVVDAGGIARQQFIEEESYIHKAGWTILRTLWNANDILGYVEAIIPKETFADVHKEIIDYLKRCSDEDRSPNDVSAAEELSNAAYNELIRILSTLYESPNTPSIRAFNDAVLIMRITTLEDRYNRLMNEAKKYVLSDDNKYEECIKSSMTLLKQIEELKIEINRRIKYY